MIANLVIIAVTASRGGYVDRGVADFANVDTGVCLTLSFLKKCLLLWLMIRAYTATRRSSCFIAKRVTGIRIKRSANKTNTPQIAAWHIF
jgi:hypothetical protein